MSEKASMLVWGAVVGLFVLLAALLMEPCSGFRLRVVATTSGFGPLDTYASPIVSSVHPMVPGSSLGRCICTSNGRTIVEGEGGRPVEMSHTAPAIEPEVVF